jgi:hypothetical protein
VVVQESIVAPTLTTPIVAALAMARRLGDL